MADVVTLEGTKADQIKFDLFLDSTDQRLQDTMQYTQLNRNMVVACHNFIDKYQPLFVARQIAETVDAVTPDIKVRYKLKKFLELKEEVLTKQILSDDGTADLKDKVEIMKTSLMTGEPTPDEKEMKPILKKLS